MGRYAWWTVALAAAIGLVAAAAPARGQNATAGVGLSNSGLVSPGDQYERASYCVLSGESIVRALADPACNRVAAAEDSQDSARGYPESDAAADARAGDPADARYGTDPAPEACPQPWCSFSLVRLRLTELGGI